MSTAYKQGQVYALRKVGVAMPMLGGAALGGLAGYALSPYDRSFTGTLTGAALGGAGAGVGNKLAPLLHNAASNNSAAGRAAMPVLGAGLGALGGVAAAQGFTNKKEPHRSEDPYQYYSG